MAKQQPEHVIRYGSIKAVIWKNDTEKGIRHNVTVARIYKDGDDWKESSSFGRDDLLAVAEVTRQAWCWIHEKSQREQQRDAA